MFKSTTYGDSKPIEGQRDPTILCRGMKNARDNLDAYPISYPCGSTKIDGNAPYLNVFTNDATVVA